MGRVVVPLVALIVAVVAFLPGTGSAEGRPSQWLGSWAASPQQPDPKSAGFHDQTLREIVDPHAGGPALRVRLSNVFGSAPLTVGQARVALRGPGGSIVPGTDRPLTFGGAASTTLPPDAEAISDPAWLGVEAGQELAISIFLPDATGPAPFHALAATTSYVASGDHAADLGPGAFTGTTGSWYALDGVDVLAPRTADAVVALGDSITDGFASTTDANRRWPDVLAARLDARSGNRTSVLNEGISGNRVLADSACCGVNALARLDRDVLAQDGARSVILLEGINDIGFAALSGPPVSAAQIIAGYRQIIAQVHLKGLRIYGATLTPFQGAFYERPAGLAARDALNDFIRHGGAFDGVVDFDRATRDPAQPERLLPAFDSGDHLHPNDAGYRAMGDAVPLSLFPTS